MVAFAWTEADQKTDSFKRWFDEGDADNVKKVLERLITPTGIQQPTEQMKDWICEKDDNIEAVSQGRTRTRSRTKANSTCARQQLRCQGPRT